MREAQPVSGVWNHPHPNPLPWGEGTKGASYSLSWHLGSSEGVSLNLVPMPSPEKVAAEVAGNTLRLAIVSHVSSPPNAPPDSPTHRS